MNDLSVRTMLLTRAIKAPRSVVWGGLGQQ